MKLLLTALYFLYFISYMMGCAYKGDVYLYSPQGEGIAVEKALDTQIDIPLLP